MRKALLLASALALFGCDEEKLNVQERLFEPRILAMQAEPPQPGFAQPTTLRALIYLPTKIDESVDCTGVPPGGQYKWSWCPMATTNTSGYACPFTQADFDQLFAGMGLGPAPSLDLGTGETATLVNPFPAPILRALCTSKQSAFVSCDLPAQSDPDPNDPVAFPVTVTLEYTPPCGTPKRQTFPATMTSIFTVHLPVDDAAPRNQNPVIGDIFRIDNLPDAGAEPDAQPVAEDAGGGGGQGVDGGESLDGGEGLDGGTTPVSPDAGTPTPDAPVVMPTFGGVRLDETVVLPRQKRLKLRLQIPQGATEPLARPWRLDQVKYSGSDPNGNKVLYFEHLSLSWFAEAGDFGGDHGNTGGRQTGFLPTYNQREFGEEDRKQLELASLQLWTLPTYEDFKQATARVTVVLRDGHGGATWTSAIVSVGDEQ
jgi:hypothetical protein